jgi:hypothetical protein
VKLDPRLKTMTYYATVNLYANHDKFPPDGIRVMGISMVPDAHSMVQTSLVKEYPVLTLYSVGNVHNSTQFTWRAMAGSFNTFGSRYRIDCATKKVSEVDSSRHIGSPCDLYGRYLACLSKKKFDKCHQIQEKTFKMMNHVSAGQLKTNLIHIDMEPGMWWMLVLHTRKASTLATPTHPVFYSDSKITSLYQSMERTYT